MANSPLVCGPGHTAQAAGDGTAGEDQGRAGVAGAAAHQEQGRGWQVPLHQETPAWTYPPPPPATGGCATPASRERGGFLVVSGRCYCVLSSVIEVEENSAELEF